MIKCAYNEAKPLGGQQGRFDDWKIKNLTEGGGKNEAKGKKGERTVGAIDAGPVGVALADAPVDAHAASAAVVGTAAGPRRHSERQKTKRHEKGG